ncbi:MAG: sensor histidine kinase [Spirochaetales bacterium]|jgi:anti-sigma regulatory factor (Ser/Thr protein kinase)
MHYDIVDFVIDIAQNSCEAGAKTVEVSFEEDEKSIGIRVVDDGKGMGAEELERSLNPFFTNGLKHPGRRVGLGLSFLRQAIDINGGQFSIRSEKGQGTEVAFRFDKEQVDCPPTGDVPGMILSILCLPGAQEMIIRRKIGQVSYELRKSELAEALGNLEEVSSLVALKQYLRSQEEGEELWQG